MIKLFSQGGNLIYARFENFLFVIGFLATHQKNVKRKILSIHRLFFHFLMKMWSIFLKDCALQYYFTSLSISKLDKSKNKCFCFECRNRVLWTCLKYNFIMFSLYEGCWWLIKQVSMYGLSQHYNVVIDQVFVSALWTKSETQLGQSVISHLRHGWTTSRITKPLNLNFKGIVAKLEHLNLLHKI